MWLTAVHCSCVQTFILFYLFNYHFFFFCCYHFWWNKDCHYKDYCPKPLVGLAEGRSYVTPSAALSSLLRSSKWTSPSIIFIKSPTMVTVSELTRSSAVARKADRTAYDVRLSGIAMGSLVTCKLPCFGSSQYVLNLFARWRQCLWFKRWDSEGISWV